MEKQFYKDDFEQLLQEQADRFTMEPTKRVWHSVYNDLHPSRRWPSIAISLLLILSLFVLGYLNTKNSQSTTAAIQPLAEDGATAIQKTAVQDQPILSNQPAAIPADLMAAAPPPLHPAAGTGVRSSYGSNTQPAPGPAGNNTVHSTGTPGRRQLPATVGNRHNSLPGTVSSDATGVSAVPPADVAPAATPVQNESISTNSVTATTNQDIAVVSTADATSEESAPLAADNNTPGNSIAKSFNQAVSTAATNERSAQSAALKSNKLPDGTVLTEDKAWMEADALYNLQRRSKWKGRMSWTAYATPSYSYRNLFVNSPSGNPGVLPNLLISPNNQNADKSLTSSVDQKAALGLEAGAALVYAYSKKIRIKTGIQFNYTNYYTFANEFDHPITTSLTFNNLNSGNLEVVARSSRLANSNKGTNSNRLNNRSYQIALPVGFDFKLKNFSNLTWYAGASVQPAFVLGGNSYLLSSDRAAYVDDSEQQKSLMRRFNVAMGVETFVNYQKGNYNFMVGPQLRYQLLTTNSKTYTVGEKVYNIGIKLGVLKSL